VDLVLYVSDLSEEFDFSELESILSLNENVIVIFNKYDKEKTLPDISKYKLPFSAISAKEKSGIEDLTEIIKNYIEEKFGDDSSDNVMLSERHFEALSVALTNLNNAVAAISSFFEADIISIDLENAASALGEITGQTVNDEVIDNIFKNFCIGK